MQLRFPGRERTDVVPRNKEVPLTSTLLGYVLGNGHMTDGVGVGRAL